jgi:ABC-2 type transport system permease protein
MPLVPVCPSTTSPGLIQTVYRFSFRQLMVGRSAKVLMLLGLVPVAASILWRIYLGQDAPLVLSIVSSGFYTHLFLFVFTLAFGCSAIRDEIETSTMAYLFTRPVSRFSIYLGKMLSSTTAAALLLIVSYLLSVLVIAAGNGDVLIQAWRVLVILVLGSIVYTSVFVLLGAALSRPFLAGVMYAFVWEVFVPFMPGLVKKISIMHFLFHIFPGTIRQQFGDIPPQVVSFLGSNPPSRPECFAGLAIFLVGSTILGMWLFSRKEYFLK